MRWANDLTLDSANDLIAAAYDLPPRIFKAYILLGAHCRRRGFVINAGRRVADAVMLSPRFWAETAAPRLEEHGFEERDGCLLHPEVEGVKANPRSEINRRNAAQRWARERERQARLSDPPLDAAGDRSHDAIPMQSDAIASDLHSESHAKSTSALDANATVASASHANSHARARAGTHTDSDSFSPESLESPDQCVVGGGVGEGRPARLRDANGMQIASPSHAPRRAGGTGARGDRDPDRAADRDGGKHRLPPDWQPAEPLRQAAREQGVDPDALAEELRLWADANNAWLADWGKQYMRFVSTAARRRQRGMLLPLRGGQAASPDAAAAPRRESLSEQQRALKSLLDGLWALRNTHKAGPMPPDWQTAQALDPAKLFEWGRALKAWFDSGRQTRRPPDWRAMLSVSPSEAARAAG